MAGDMDIQEEREERKMVFDENPHILDGERLPVHETLKVIRYRTLKKNSALGWWSAVVFLEDHKKKEICFYRWRRRGDEWKRDKKLPIKSRAEWQHLKEAVESFLADMDK
jgi:hypothetical protein